jgi:hypothetical protein
VVRIHQVGGRRIVPNDVHYTAFDSASWAVTSDTVSPMLGANKQDLYDNFINGCNLATFKGNMEENSGIDCIYEENYRLRSNREQPMSVYNYTKMGYKKIKAPASLMEVIFEFWNKNREKAVTEDIGIDVYLNSWDSPVRLDCIERIYMKCECPKLGHSLFVVETSRISNITVLSSAVYRCSFEQRGKWRLG